jgi:hypothetical protein
MFFCVFSLKGGELWQCFSRITGSPGLMQPSFLNLSSNSDLRHSPQFLVTIYDNPVIEPELTKTPGLLITTVSLTPYR